VVCDQIGRPLAVLLSAGQVSDHKGAALLLPALPQAKTMLADKRYDSNWFRNALIDRQIAPCIPSNRTRKHQLPYDKGLYRQRHFIENLFAKLKDWRAYRATSVRTDP
jgi:transposase